jgi:hypothetical protein
MAEHERSHHAEVRRIEDHQAVDPVPELAGYSPGHDASPVVPDQNEPAHVQGVGEPGDVFCKHFRAIGPYALRLVAQIVAAHIGRDHTETGGGQRTDLVSPCPPELGKAVEQENRGSAFIARFHDVQPHVSNAHVM